MKMEISPQALAQIKQALQQHHLIEAIKIFRQATGVGLKEAKEAVEAMQAGSPVEGLVLEAAELPLKCPDCAASLSAAIVRWVTSTTAECPYCGGYVRGGRSG
jgi:hypothetical protein